MNHERFMDEAIKEARQGLKEGGIPIGSVLVKNFTQNERVLDHPKNCLSNFSGVKQGKIIGRGHNRRVQENSAILHAEMNAIEDAGRLSANDYKKCILYSTLSPCDMCSGTILLYKIPTLVIGENKTFKGPENYLKKRGVKIINLNSQECKKMMADFIKKKPKLWNEDIGE